MKKSNFIIIGFLFTALIIGCQKDHIPRDKYLIFEEKFLGDNIWTIHGEIDSSNVEPGEANGEVSNGVLNLHATGCTQVEATHQITLSELTSEVYNKMTLTVDIEEFDVSPIVSSSNKIVISFKDFNLTIKPKKVMNNIQLVFKLNGKTIDIAEPTDAVEYSFSKTSNDNKILVNLKSESIADCIANAKLKLKSIKIYKK